MAESLEILERRIDELRAQVRRAVTAGDRDRGRALRAELRAAERAWSDAVEQLDALAQADAPVRPAAPRPGSLLPIREQVHQALTLLGVPAAARLILAVHDAFFSGPLVPARLTSIRRDEERSFRAAPHARAYYLCAALTADLLAPARGLLAVSTWKLDRRVIGPLSPRVDYLTAAVHVAQGIQRLPDAGAEAPRLLRKFAANIPGVHAGAQSIDPDQVIQAARAELAVHQGEDAARRAAAAARASAQLRDADQLFGSRLRITRSQASA
ncbi:MAG TPA: hypothetical protein VK586_23605 [Streptosporangiaceae bacterium]|nr:hypothetical protein [Streptosporangiaceae bacterium]